VKRVCAVCAVAAVLLAPACFDAVPPSASEGPVSIFTAQAPATSTAPSLAPLPGGPALGGELIGNPARTMVTGTLTVTTGGEFAVAADSERDEIVVITLASRTAKRVALKAGDEPARTIGGKVDASGTHAYSLLRGAAALADVNVTEGDVERVPTCQAPRGVAYDARQNLVHVACATSELVSYDADSWETVRHIAVARDLRDVVIVDEGLLLSRFASAELLLVDDAGKVSVVGEPRVPPSCAEPAVMHRIVGHGGNLYAAHQLATTDVVFGRNGGSDCAVAQSATAYWRAPLAEVVALAEAGSVANPSAGNDYWSQFVVASDRVPLRDESAEFKQDVRHLARLGSSVGPMDLAVSEQGRVVVSVAGNFWQESEPTILAWDHERAPVEGLLSAFRPGGMVTSVAFDGDGQWLAQSREPAAIYFEDGGILFFGGRSVNNTAYSLFHMNGGAGVSCASCHPEGGEDGQVWRFPHGVRRTLPLGPAMGIGPYSWDARDLDMNGLLWRVLNQQMSHDFIVTYDQSDALASWLGELRAPSPGVVTNIGATDRGRRVFADAGCASCHAGQLYTQRAYHDVGSGGSFETPSLLGVGGRSQLLHDGCAATLRDVLGACGGDESHRVLDNLTLQQVNDLITFLATL
jgi:hypothetical protein